MADVRDLGRIPYENAWELQKQLVDQRIAGQLPDTVLICEHDPVYTLGRRREARQHLLDIGDTPVFEIERGGDVTFHGPGQVVAYPIVQMPEGDVLKHLRRLEELMIRVSADFGLMLERDPRNAGVWHQGRKVGSVGIASRRGVSWHGLALNVSTDLSWFRRIHPCGLPSEWLSSMEAETGRSVPLETVKQRVIAEFQSW